MRSPFVAIKPPKQYVVYIIELAKNLREHLSYKKNECKTKTKNGDLDLDVTF
jgi:hypothetical protein